MRWSSVLRRLSVFTAPLLLATTVRKKKSPRKQFKRKPKRSSKKAKARPVKRRASRKLSRRKRVTAKLARKAQPKGKAAQAAPKVVEEEPLLPPVPPIGRAILLVPKDATYVESFHPTFRWLSVGGATRYEVQWGEEQALTSKYSAISLATEATVPVEKPLRVGAVYYWRVRGGNDAGWGPWSPVSSFRVLEETP